MPSFSALLPFDYSLFSPLPFLVSNTYLTSRSDFVLPRTQRIYCLRGGLSPVLLARNECFEHAVQVLQSHTHLTKVPQKLRALCGTDLGRVEEVLSLVDFLQVKKNRNYTLYKYSVLYEYYTS